MTALAQTARLAITTAIEARLDTLRATGVQPQLTVYPGEVRRRPGDPEDAPVPPLLVNGGQPDPSGRVAPYAIVYGAPGRPDVDASLEAKPSSLLWSGQVTFAAGHRDDLLALLDDAMPLLTLWVPTVDGLTCGPLRAHDGFNPGPPRPDERPQPPRFYTPTLWQLYAA